VTETVVSFLTSPQGDERVRIVHRPDGTYTYRRQWADRHRSNDPDAPIASAQQRAVACNWGEMGPACGIYDSAFTAENEARLRVPWLHPISH
jgi:hypothetical protein